MILTFSLLICRFQGKMKSFKFGILPFLGILGVIVGLLVMEPHFSASIIIIALGGVMMFLGGVGLGWFIAAIGTALGGLTVLLTFFPMPPAASAPGWTPSPAPPTRAIR
ncbi:MAG: hypothetical protein V8T45_07000 [Oscillospiraceae bacterium]